MPFTIVRQDITKMDTDAIVNAANTDLIMGGGVCGAIFRAAGARELQEACNKLAPIRTGSAAITPGFALAAKFVIHAAGPIYGNWSKGDAERLLRSAYISSLELAHKNGCGSIAFPLISSGIYGYPKDEALKVAVSAIRDFLDTCDMDVYLAIFDRRSFEVSKELLGAVTSYIDENYISSHTFRRSDISSLNMITQSVPSRSSAVPPQKDTETARAKALDDVLGELDEPFNTTLLKLIDARGKTDAEVYKRANIDRKLFSKIRTGKGYTPGKRTILALAIALELNLQETDDLLKRAGYTLSHSRIFDVIVEFFIINKKYDIFEINEVLFKYDQPLLGAG